MSCFAEKQSLCPTLSFHPGGCKVVCVTGKLYLCGLQPAVPEGNSPQRQGAVCFLLRQGLWEGEDHSCRPQRQSAQQLHGPGLSSTRWAACGGRTHAQKDTQRQDGEILVVSGFSVSDEYSNCPFPSGAQNNYSFSILCVCVCLWETDTSIQGDLFKSSAVLRDKRKNLAKINTIYLGLFLCVFFKQYMIKNLCILRFKNSVSVQLKK